jgi:cell division protein FtsI (penicillin-binding protein 3)
VERLEQQVVASDAPGRLAEDAAAARLVPAGPAGYLVIAPDGTVTLRGTPAPATDPAAAPSGPGD